MNLKKLARYIPLVVVLALGSVFIYLNRGQLTALSSLRLVDVLGVAGVLFVFFVATGFTFYLLVGLVSVRLSLIEWLGLTFLTNFGNYLGPARPGAAIKAVYLKGQKRLPYARFSAVLAANGFLIFLVSGVVGLILLGLLWLQTGLLPPELMLVCIGLIVASTLPFVLRLPSIQRQGRVWQILNSAVVGFGVIKSKRRELLAVCGSVLLQYLLSACLMVVAYRALGQNISLTAALIIGVFTSISNFFTITPNNLGIQEIVMAYLYSVTGMDFASGLIGAGLIRAVHIAMTFGLTPVFTHLMLRSSNLSLSAILPGRGAGPDAPEEKV